MRLSTLSFVILSAIAVSSVHAEDAASHFSVLDANHFAVEAELLGTKTNGSEVDRLPDNLLSDGRPALSGTSRSYSSYLLANVYVGLGSGFELSANLPYIMRNHTEISYNDGRDYIYNKDGLTDVTLGLKYRAFKSKDDNDTALIKGTFLHHSNSVGTMHVEIDYLHQFSSSLKNGIEFYYDKKQGGPDSIGASDYLIYRVTPQVSFSPYISISKVLGYANNFSYSTYAGGAQLSYQADASLVITPAITFGHMNEVNNNFYANIIGPQHYVTGSLFVRKTF